MIGDNRRSDFTMAKRSGLNAVLKKRREARETDDLKLRAKLGANWKKLAALAEENKDMQLVNFAFPLYLLTKRLGAELEARGIKDILFFSREGQFFKRLFEIYQARTGKCRGVKAHYFLASRNSMMTASLYPLEEEKFACVVKNTFLEMLSANTFLVSLGFSPEQIAALQSRLSFDFNKTYLHFNATKQYRALLSDGLFGQYYEELRTSCAAGFGAYLNRFGLDYKTDGLCVFDVGWKGLIQDLLQKFVGDGVKMHGFYLGTCEKNEYDMTCKTGLLCSDKNKKYKGMAFFERYKMLYEQICRADHGHPEKYVLQSDGSCEVVLDDGHKDKEYFDALFSPLQVRIAHTFGEICKLDYDKYSQMENAVVRIRYYSVTHLTAKDYRWQLDAEDCHYDSFCRVGYRLAMVGRGARIFAYKFMDGLFAIKYCSSKNLLRVNYKSKKTYR